MEADSFRPGGICKVFIRIIEKQKKAISGLFLMDKRRFMKMGKK